MLPRVTCSRKLHFAQTFHCCPARRSILTVRIKHRNRFGNIILLCPSKFYHNLGLSIVLFFSISSFTLEWIVLVDTFFQIECSVIDFHKSCDNRNNGWNKTVLPQWIRPFQCTIAIYCRFSTFDFFNTTVRDRVPINETNIHGLLTWINFNSRIDK